MSPTLIHLVRHGEVHNPAGLLYGRLPGFRLSRAGEQMALADAGYFASGGAPVSRVIASPLLRAQQTAAPIAGAFGLGIESDPRLIEAANRIEGHPARARTFVNPARWPLLRNPLTPSWGEPYDAIAARMSGAINDACRAGQGQRIVLVSHQLPIWTVRCYLTGKRLWHDPRRRECDLASVTTFRFEGEHLTGVTYETPAAAVVRGK